MRIILLALIACASAKNVFVSSPFDNFRIECPKRAAATELSVRMVESVGQKRQDVVFDLSCETIEQLYPWVNIPVGISDIEREDCRYSEMVDPILDYNTSYTCAAREYMAGITRLSDTRIQIMCCKLRSRDEFNCGETVFNKPIGLSRSTLIEHENQLINAIKLGERGYIVRFCDLAPRTITAIYEDEKIKTTTQATTTERHDAPTPPAATIPHKENSQKIVKTVKSAKQYSIPTATVEAIQEVDSLARNSDFELDTTTETPTTRPLENPVLVNRPQVAAHLPEKRIDGFKKPVQNFAPRPTPPVLNQPLVDDIIRKLAAAQSEQKAAIIFQQSLNQLIQNAESTIAPTTTTTTVGPPASMPAEEVELSHLTFPNQEFPKPKEEVKPRFSKELLPLRRDLDHSDLVFLQPINAEGHRRAPIRTHRPHIEIWSSEEDEDTVVESTKAPKKIVKKIIKKVVRGHRHEQQEEVTTSLQVETPSSTAMTTTTSPAPSTKKFSSAFFGSFEDNRDIKFPTTERTTRIRSITTTPSPRRDLSANRNVVGERQLQKDNARDFDEDTINSPFDQYLESTTARSVATTTKDEKPIQIEFQEDEDIEEVISKLSSRRSEIRRSPVRNSIADAQFADKTVEDEPRSLLERDGVRTFESIDAKPIDVKALGTEVESELVENNKEGVEFHVDELVPMTQEVESGEKSTEESSASSTTLPTTSSYDPMNFYKTPRPRMMRKEKILRFCSKDTALRDQSNMVIACGSELEEWIPSRCPANSDCFMSHDSLYRICCPVHRG